MSENHFKRLRRSRGFKSADVLAEATSGVVSRAVIANIETGRKSTFSVPQLLALCQAMNVRVDEIVPELSPYIGTANGETVARAKRELMDEFEGFLSGGVTVGEQD